MKFTYLVYKQVNGARQLAITAQEEWDAILKENRRLPLEQRRRFMKDCIEDGAEVDCMYIEVPVSEHREWNSKNTIRQKERKIGMRYTHLSLDAGVPDTDAETMHECVSSEFNLEGVVADQVLMEELKCALRAWQPWAEELMEAVERANRLYDSLFQNYHDKLLTEREYTELRQQYQADGEAAEKWLDALERQRQDERQQTVENPWLTTCGWFRADTELTEDMAHALIDRVEVDADNRISITLRYRDEYRALLRLLEAEGEAVPA